MSLIFLSPVTEEGCRDCTAQNGYHATIWTTGVEKLSSAGELKEGEPTPSLHVS